MKCLSRPKRVKIGRGSRVGWQRVAYGQRVVRCWQLIRHSPTEDGPPHQGVPGCGVST